MGKKTVYVCDLCEHPITIPNGYYRAVVSGYKTKNKATNRTFYFCTNCGDRIFPMNSTEGHEEGEKA